ncbi:complexed with cef1p [Apiospora aurea]|uniref:Complexed with cef1p n=1 Tax=Apiospora aurea TaxID=335848 RepID=A0ABR1PVH7_9PEZI
MTTAHRPTFDPARGKEALRGPAYHQRLLPAHTQLKYRQPGQGGDADNESEDAAAANGTKRPLALTSHADGEGDGEDPEAKRRRILEESRDIDADDDEDDDDEDDDDDDDDDSDEEDSDDDDEAELQRELEKIRREKAERREKEEAERAAAEEEERERDIALGNPLLNKQNFSMKRRWNDDVVFKNQARGTEDKGKKKEFVNDLLRSDFHKRFMGKYRYPHRMNHLMIDCYKALVMALGVYCRNSWATGLLRKPSVLKRGKTAVITPSID